MTLRHFIEIRDIDRDRELQEEAGVYDYGFRGLEFRG